MRVRIRLNGGPQVRHRKRKNRHVALASAALLTPAAVMAFVLSMWRLGSDLGFAGSFAIQNGILSHWQVWLAISVTIQFLAVLLNRYGNPEPGMPVVEIREPRTGPIEQGEREAEPRTLFK